jgi:hypothetical protein
MGVTRKIFLSYRRDDSSGYAQHIYGSLARRYGQGAVFLDVHAIHPIERFRSAISDAIVQSGLLVVVMSKQWTTISGADGRRRLLDPDDVVCWEIAGAFTNHIPVLPLLVGGATMPSRMELPDTIQALVDISAHVLSDANWEQDFERLAAIVDRTLPSITSFDTNPFSIRAGIVDDAFFHGRERERRMLRDFIKNRQNCQLVGERRIGKSSLVRYVERHAGEWVASARVAYLDLQDPRCYTLRGWLKEVGHRLSLSTTPATLVDLAESIEDLLSSGVCPVLCLDEFGEMARRDTEFTQDVLLTLRSFGQRGMSIISASTKRLSELTNPQYVVSAFFNAFPVIQVRRFAPVHAREYLDKERPGVPIFTETEKQRILEFANGHPFALQCACFHVLSARGTGEDLASALRLAQEESGAMNT